MARACLKSDPASLIATARRRGSLELWSGLPVRLLPLLGHVDVEVTGFSENFQKLSVLLQSSAEKEGGHTLFSCVKSLHYRP